MTPKCDLLIRIATLIDGTGAPRFQADVVIESSRIAAAEILHMRAAAEEALEAGAIGVSTDLYYEPAAAAAQRR